MFYVYVGVSVLSIYHLSSVLTEDRRDIQVLLELGLQEVVSHLMWVLRTKFGSYERTASALNC